MASPITCHVLNTLSGTPASDLKATLTPLLQGANPAPVHDGPTFSATTDQDGRVKEWKGSGESLQDFLEPVATGERLVWSIKFEIGPWYEAKGIECFWPEIEVKFYIKKGERHYHVPVLVGPWTYTTYRGS